MRLILVACVLSVSVAACGHSSSAASASTVWLCRPGLAGNPCAASLNAVVVAADGTRTVQETAPATHSAFDCFYVYPTVSNELTPNADLTVQPAETAVAYEQASRFSQVCDVWAPMYRQQTVSDITLGLSDAASQQTAYASLLSAWQDYLAHDNHGRPIVFIGHSQGAAQLIRLLSKEVDANAALRRQLVSAILLGGNVEVPMGATVGGTFAHIPACRSTAAAGCVIAYSSFLYPPPSSSLFGRPGQGVSLQSGQTGTTGLQVVCTTPSSGPLTPYFGTGGRWVTYPGLYRAHCESTGGATWLQVDVTRAPGDTRPVVTQSLGPNWGLHLEDVNIALGDLVRDVSSQEAAFHA